MSNQVVVAESAATHVFLGLQFQFLVTPGQAGGNLCLMRNVMVPGLLVPLHSHSDPEIFHVLEGEVDIYQDGAGWNTVHAGEVLALAGSVKHALRTRVHCVCTTATGDELIRFFLEAAAPMDTANPPGRPSPEEFARLLALARKWNMTIFSPEENAAIGLNMDQR